MANEQGNYSVFRSAVDNNSNFQQIPFPDFNETIRFNGNSKTYKELVYTSRIKETLNLPIEVLTNNSTTSRLALRNERKGTNVVPRPQNSWIIYRRDKYADPEFEGVKSCIASIKIGEKWKTENNEVLEYFAALSMLALENHQKKYGGYKYQPKSRVNRRSKQSKDRQRRNKENVENKSPETNNETSDLPQLVVTLSSPTNEYPTPVSSTIHSPVDSQDDFSEQTNNNSYFISPPLTNQNSPVIFQDQNLHLSTSQDWTLEDILSSMDSDIDPTTMCPDLSAVTPPLTNQNSPVTFLSTNQDSFQDILSLIDPTTIMCPNLSAIAPTNDFSTYNNNPSVVSDNFSEFLHDADKLAFSQSSLIDTTTPNVEDYIDFELYENETHETLMSNNIILSTVEEPTNMDQLFYSLPEYDNYDPFMATPFMDQLDIYDNDSHPYSE